MPSPCLKMFPLRFRSRRWLHKQRKFLRVKKPKLRRMMAHIDRSPTPKLRRTRSGTIKHPDFNDSDVEGCYDRLPPWPCVHYGEIPTFCSPEVRRALQVGHPVLLVVHRTAARFPPPWGQPCDCGFCNERPEDFSHQAK